MHETPLSHYIHIESFLLYITLWIDYRLPEIILLCFFTE